MHRKLIGLCFAIALIALIDRSPWLAQDFAQARAVDSFNPVWFSGWMAVGRIVQDLERSSRNAPRSLWR